MNYEPMLKILSRITDEDGDKKTEMTVNAKISGTENDYMIEYDENIVPDSRDGYFFSVCKHHDCASSRFFSRVNLSCRCAPHRTL